ncbi:MAG: YciI family protein [Magnetospirillum sp.]|nr:YciI family protein [Magnetospirillum sp.]
MLWAVWCRDGDDVAAIRSERSKEHSAYLNASPLRVVVAGPLTTDDGAAPAGSLLVFEAGSRREVEELVAGDPFARSGVWRSFEVRAFRMSRADIRTNGPS